MLISNEWLGSAKGTSGSFLVNSYGSFKVVYTAGKYGLDDGGSIRIARRGGMRPQAEIKDEPGYTSVKTNRDVRLVCSNARHIRPFWSAFQITVRGGSLCEGDQIEITFGDTSYGSPGIRLKNIREMEHIFKVFVDPFGSGHYKPIVDSPYITIIGEKAKEIQIVGPSQIVKGESFEVTVRALDVYGNRSDIYRGIVSINSNESDGFTRTYKFSEEDAGVHNFSDIRLDELGLQRLNVSDDNGLTAISNSIQVLDEKPEFSLYWGDMHGQTKETVGSGSVPEYLSYIRDVAGLDFGGWQGNDFQVTAKLWYHVKEQICKFHEQGRFITFLGYEWSGLTPAGGDHNIYYLGDDENIYRSDHWLIESPVDPESDRYPISELWETFKGRKDVLAIPHVGGRYANFDFYDPDHIPLIEVHSNHGTFEWFIDEAMKRRMKVGFIAASDDHTCRPGLTYANGGMATRGGYTGVYAKELTREALWEAFWARRAYGTTGEKIILKVESNGYMMGDEYSTQSTPSINVKIVGTAPLVEVEVFNWEKPVFYHPFAEPEEDDKLIKVEWSGASVRSRPKIVNWNGGLTVKNGKILYFKKFAFDYPNHGIEMKSDTELSWVSTTGGDPDGVILKLEEGSEVTFSTNPITFKFKTSDIEYYPKVIKAGKFTERVKISTIKELLPDILEFTFIDEKCVKGFNAYWVRVVQINGAMAWSSPIFIHYS